MKKLILIAALLLGGVSAQAQEATTTNEKGVKEVIFNCEIDCHSCEAKIMKNLPYEKGVKDVSVDLAKKQVTVKYRADKNSDAALQVALTNLGYESSLAKKDEKKGEGEACHEGHQH
ncbi:MAG: heavy-metal-associated domain-containing protein [Mangrovibacterium sp.]